MTFPDQIDKLVAKLTELTVKDKVDWQETASLNTYLARVDKFMVTINKGGSEVFGGYSFQILDHAGRAIEGALAPFSGGKNSHGPFELGASSGPVRNSEATGSAF